jgi:hypothetical protein
MNFTFLFLLVVAAGVLLCAMALVAKPPPPRPPVRPWPYSVPKQIWQTWHTHDLPEAMRLSTQRLKNAHPEYKYTLMDDDESLQFIKDNYPPEVADAYDTLIPGAFKADLWRLCALHKVGGIYLDIKFAPVEPASLRDLGDKSHFVSDRNIFFQPRGIYNGFMAAAPGDPRLEAAIRQLVKNVQDRKYGKSALEPTGPHLVALFVRHEHGDVDLQYGHTAKDVLSRDNRVIWWKGASKKQPFLQCYSGYRAEQKSTQKAPYYVKLWRKRKIYKEDKP